MALESHNDFARKQGLYVYNPRRSKAESAVASETAGTMWFRLWPPPLIRAIPLRGKLRLIT